ncbi:uncharacterized protein ATC70_008560 [Mucor velutinosus]|uniref:TRP C-terminal domain-containing protein n=1 Tax=Mucor velutinosus TaxID=708070 RepID=A0AAN7DSL2_9FUNG|nr:hypothetical protein ATC70_008560 [Mucor velutinosus]
MLILFILLLSIQSIVAQNFSLCHKDGSSKDQNLFQISWVNTNFDANQFKYTFNILGMATRENITNLNPQHSYYAAAKTKISLGVSDAHTTVALNRFCQDVYQDCPVIMNNYTLIQKTVQLPYTNVPLLDIIAQYSAWTGEQTPITCLTLAPIAYQNPLWTRLFRYIPIGVAGLALITTCVAIYATTPIDRNEITVHCFPTALQLALPSVFQVVYYAQFIVTMGQLNLSYPKFYPLFASDFAWSFLMLPSHWITQNTHLANQPAQQQPATDGMSNYAANIGLDVNDVFITVFVYFLLLVALCLIGLAIVWLIAKLQKIISTADAADDKYTDVAYLGILKIPQPTWNSIVAILLKCVTLCYLPLTITGLYQLMLPSQWYMLLVAALVVVFLSFLLYGWIAFVMLKLGDTASVLIQSATFTRIGFLYCLFSDGHATFFFATIVYNMITSLMVGIFQKSGLAQLIVIILIEAAYFAFTLVKWPYVTKQMNVFFTLLGFLRLTSILLNITHVSSLSISDYTKQCVAYAQVCFHMLVFVLFLCAELKNLMAILLGTSDKQFEEGDTMPVRMMTWPRYKRNINRSYFNHEEEQSENGLLLDAPDNSNPLHQSESPYRRHLSVVPPLSNDNSTDPPALPPHIEMSRLSLANPATIPLLSVPPIAATNDMYNIDLNDTSNITIAAASNRSKHHSDSNLHSKYNDTADNSLENVSSTAHRWSDIGIQQAVQKNYNHRQYPLI